MSNFALSVLVTLTVTIEPLGTAMLFLGLTPGMGADERRGIALRAVAIATVVLLASRSRRPPSSSLAGSSSSSPRST
jgi:small neutral amino acid transporter SnatA (MarC family)